MTINQISIFLENKSGRLAEVAKTLSDGGINLRAAMIADTADFGILRIVVDNYEKASMILEENNFTTRVTKVLGIEVEDTPGGLYRIMKLFKDNNVNIEYIYASLARKDGKAIVVFKVENVEKGLEIIKESTFVAVSEKDL